MKAIVRNILLACLISTFAFFGAVGGRHTRLPVNTASIDSKHSFATVTEAQKETFTCLGVALLAWVLCLWRCSVLNKRLNTKREYKRRFNEYMRSSSLNRHYY